MTPTQRVFDIPMRLRFRGQQRRQGVLLEGAAGWGEFSPFPDYDAATTGRWLAAAIEAAERGWPEPRRTRVPVNVTVPAVDPQTAHRLVAQSGCETAKVKVAEPGQSLADDIARVEAVRDALGPAGRIRVDANGAWSVDAAHDALRQLSEFGLEYAEQPVADLSDMAALRRLVDVPLAADESVRLADDPLRIAGLEAAEIVVLKVQPLGGVRACLEIAEQCGLPVVVSSAVETSVGLAAGVALAAALPELPYACGLGTVPLLDADVCSRSLQPVNGALPVLLAAPEPDRAAAVAADEATTQWWQRRLDDARAALDAA